MTCSGKECFGSYALAERIARLSANRHRSYKMAAYKCVECGSFHVGSKVGKPLDKRKGRYFYTLDEEAGAF